MGGKKHPPPEAEKNMTTEENISAEENNSAEDYSSGLRDYWRQVGNSDGFDVEDVSVPSYMYGRITGLISCDCQRDKCIPYRVLVQRYAMLGLHRYNMLEGTRFKFASLLKFNKSQNCLSSFYMTLLARDQDPSTSTLDRTFQVRVDEKEYESLDLTCSIARFKEEVTTEKKEPFVPHFHGGARADGIFKGELPDWPSDDDAFNDGKRFYVVKESECQASDWISMYLELVICTHDRDILHLTHPEEILSKLEIVKVAIETSIEDVEPPNERLKAKNANVYIIFKGLAKAQAHRRVFEIGEHVERKAIVRRVINEETGYLMLSYMGSNSKSIGDKWIGPCPLYITLDPFQLPMCDIFPNTPPRDNGSWPLTSGYLGMDRRTIFGSHIDDRSGWIAWIGI